MSIPHCATGRDSVMWAIAVSRVTIGCEKSQCSLCICYFVSIDPNFFKTKSISVLIQFIKLLFLNQL